MKVIRVIETWQRAAVYYIRINVFVKEQNIPLGMEFDEADGENAKYILLMDNDEPIATARLNIIGEQTAKIERVCVVKDCQGQGVGRELIQAAEEWAKEYGVRKIIITSQVQAQGFYESLNYKVNPNIKFESPIPIVYTEKNL
ncbi:MAG: hypothetical protein H6Q67_1191 [Firmicutes bacterium]|nr:hypothetical protein [Bacillota bacterium]